ncbi:MAG: class 1 fructose-bisphosphatase [Rhizobiales bacterium]|nr:class 1 fructose-bisphosphatase [Hyphomicrobiales bacterium]
MVPSPAASPQSVTLANDGAVDAPSLNEVLGQWAAADPGRQAMANLILRIAEASIPLAARLAQGKLPGDPTAIVGTNDSGDAQKALDMAAHDHFIEAFHGVSVGKVLSEEVEDVTEVEPGGAFDIAMDPIDGSGNIGIGAQLGAFFAIFPAGESFLRTGRDVIAAAYVSFGHSIDLGFSVGDGVHIATLDQTSGTFHVHRQNATVPESHNTIALNASYYRRWSQGLQNYVDDLMAGKEGPLERDFNFRWPAAAVGDLNRILNRGGVFLYPGDTRKGYEKGYLRLAYEAFPIAFLMEQAGGIATDGSAPVLDLAPAHLHDRVPLIFGSRREAEILHDYFVGTAVPDA